MPGTARGIAKAVIIGISISDFNATVYNPFMCYESILA